MEQIAKRCLLITGTVVPNSNFVAHASAEQRAKEYRDSLHFYRDEFPADDIYFLENSSYDFEKDPEFRVLFSGKKITLLKYPVSGKFQEGKGYQEFEMLDRAVSSLRGKYRSFIKITGRYRVSNLGQIANEPNGLIIDCQKKFRVAQTNVFCANLDFYMQHIAGLYKAADDSKGEFIEKVVYGKIAGAALWEQIAPFKKNPVITGISGSYGGTLNRNKWKMRMRNAERKLMRLLKIKQFLTEY